VKYSSDRTPSQELLIARRALEGVKNVVLLHDWLWNESSGKWTLHCRLSPEIRLGGHVPACTDWYVLIDPTYPWGSIKFYPAKEGGIVQTFPHQNYNGKGKDDVAWRDGHLCLDTSLRSLGRHGYDIEPYAVHKRLQWHFMRAIGWLSAASRDELVRRGDPFELPHFPCSPGQFASVVFCEGTESFQVWQRIPEQSGLLELCYLREKPPILLVKSFQSIDGKDLLMPSWGRALAIESGDTLRGIWLRITNVPVLDPWQAPTTWNELREACRYQGTDLDELLKTIVKSIRDGKQHIAFIGFPIPVKVGDAPCQMHWQAMLVPVLSHGSKTANGFRPNEVGYWYRDHTEILNGNTQLEWTPSENWHEAQISTRGRMPEVLASKESLVLGAGAVGTVIAELLVRAGVKRLIIMDGDQIEVGNLVRHTSGLNELKTSKAEAVAKRLNLASPHVSIDALNSNFPADKDIDKAKIQKCNVIIDCTGRDEVLHHLEFFPWNETKLFFSISLGFRAQRLFCFSASGNSFPHTILQKKLSPWLERELEEFAGEEFPRDGIGCWHQFSQQELTMCG
jgi:hypothetical protein